MSDQIPLRVSPADRSGEPPESGTDPLGRMLDRQVHDAGRSGSAPSSKQRILAPTEWNFHPQGAIARALAGLDGSDDNALRRQAALLIEAVDPCVGYRLRVQ